MRSPQLLWTLLVRLTSATQWSSTQSAVLRHLWSCDKMGYKLPVRRQSPSGCLWSALSSQGPYPPVCRGPRESIFETIIFVLSINDGKQHLTPGVKITVYAGNNAVYKRFPDRHSLPPFQADLQEDVTAISEWAESRRIKLSPTKSQATVLSHD